MAITRSRADMTPIPPAPARLHRASKPLSCAIDKNCQLSQIRESTTSGKATRAISLRTSCTMDTLIKTITAAPHSTVTTYGQ